jgi:ribose-phosphate pyrophosphokinase
MELMITVDALKRSSAKSVTAVIPYFGYGRQDRQVLPRTPITAKLVANLLTKAGIDRVVTIDLHAGQIQGFFDLPVDNLYAAPIILEDIKGRYANQDICIVSPDVGGVARARYIAKKCSSELAFIDKRREQPGVSEVMNIIGDVEGKTCILLDDIVDSAGTLCNAACALKSKGATHVVAYATHGVLSGSALDRINLSEIAEITITDTINQLDNLSRSDKFRVISVAPLVAEAIKRISEGVSVSSLFL